MTQPSTFDRLAAFACAHFGTPADAITKATTLSDVGADSLDAIDFIVDIENSFSILFADEEELQTVSNIGELAELIDHKRKVVILPAARRCA